MSRKLSAVLLAMLVLVGAMSLKTVVAAHGNAVTMANGSAPVPLPPSNRNGSAPVPLPPSARNGSAPVPLPPSARN